MSAWGAAAKSCSALLLRVERNDPTLTELVILPSKTFGGPEVERLASALKHNTHLTSIQASGHGVPPPSLRILGKALATCQTLKRIAIGDKNMGDAGVVALLHETGCCTYLERLDLAYKNISDKGMQILGASLGNSLLELNLSRNPFGNAGLMAFCEAVRNSGNLAPLTKVDISECQIGAQGLQSFAKLLLQTSCTTLVLSSNPLGSSSSPSLATLLQEGKLQDLVLGSCELGDIGVTGLCQAKTTTTLRTLDLSDNAVGHSGAKDLANALGIWQSLKDLTIANNDIGTDGMKAIAEAIISLETLDATHTNCGVEGATSLVCAIGLKRLRLFNNELGSEGFQAISALIPKIKLVELDLGGNNAAPEDLLTLLQTIRETKRITLKVLEIGANRTSIEVEEEIKRINEAHPDLDIARDRAQQRNEPKM